MPDGDADASSHRRGRCTPARGLKFEFHRYEAKHAFANETAARKVSPLEYNPQAAELAWKRTMEFLDRHLNR
ncbi:MAG: dienelactone hydrolase family protein [Betaproteobacteria bacterium]|jgi:carboxymethylenebutenolidase|nr:dienelactone hydrolase family protein [Betaproteobacteria bacterium]